MAIQTLTTMLPEWALWMHRQCIRAKNAMIPPPKHVPIFLGFTIQLFTVVDGEPAAGFRVWINRLTHAVMQNVSLMFLFFSYFMCVCNIHTDSKTHSLFLLCM
jgi:hypothetical protein